MMTLRLWTALTLSLLPALACAANNKGLGFSYNDWEIACDNTRTCRAAGYSAEGDELSLSVLLTRNAGPNQPVSTQLMLGNYGDNPALKALPKKFALTLIINRKAYGTVNIDQDTETSNLSQEQTNALLNALRGDSDITLKTGKYRWQLSDKGAAAVLLKMDEFQGRIGTTGALYKKGSAPEDKVLPALPAPVIYAVSPVKSKPADERFVRDHLKALRASLKASMGKDGSCDVLDQAPTEDMPLTATRLSPTQLLVSGRCWLAAYNEGNGYWVVEDKAPFHATLVTTDGTDFGDNQISNMMKGRGLNDCNSTETWTWDGKQFAYSSSTTSGMCRLIAPGGAWDMPQFVSDIRQPKK